mgnify:CR=1 FL=1
MNENVIEVKKDCFAYRAENGKECCSALKYLFCRGGKCGFYKHKDHFCDGCMNKHKEQAYCEKCIGTRKGL